jgi:hypothetical protein
VFATFRFDTQAFPESGKRFFSSKMSNSDSVPIYDHALKEIPLNFDLYSHNFADKIIHVNIDTCVCINVLCLVGHLLSLRI